MDYEEFLKEGLILQDGQDSIKRDSFQDISKVQDAPAPNMSLAHFKSVPSSGKESGSIWSQLHEYKNVAAVVLLSMSVLLLVTGYTVYRRKKRRRSLYQPFFGPHPSVPKISKPIDPIVYNYVCTQKPVDFVVPSSPATNALPSPVEVPAIASTSLESAGALCSKLSMLEAGPTLLGGLNPDLYKSVPEEDPEEDSFPEGHRGRLWFSLEYDVSTERLIVRVAKAKNLPSRVYGAANCCDPFVRIYLMPDERRYLQSKPKKKTCNPTFDETFLFQLPNRSMPERTLKFTVLDNDRGKHYNPLGHVMVPLKQFLESEHNTQVQWRDLEKNETQIPSDLGEMMVSLCYNQNLERLIVTVCEARGLRLPEGFKIIDTFTRIVFMREHKVVKSKKTMVCKTSRDPKYNESFHFRMAPTNVNLCSVTLQVVQAGIKEKDRILGRIVLGPYMFSRGKGLEHWEEAMSAGHKQIRCCCLYEDEEEKFWNNEARNTIRKRIENYKTRCIQYGIKTCDGFFDKEKDPILWALTNWWMELQINIIEDSWNSAETDGSKSQNIDPYVVYLRDEKLCGIISEKSKIRLEKWEALVYITTKEILRLRYKRKLCGPEDERWKLDAITSMKERILSQLSINESSASETDDSLFGLERYPRQWTRAKSWFRVKKKIVERTWRELLTAERIHKKDKKYMTAIQKDGKIWESLTSFSKMKMTEWENEVNEITRNIIRLRRYGDDSPWYQTLFSCCGSS